MKQRKWLIGILALCILLSALYAALFYTDNKYEAPPPYGKDGVISLKQSDFTQGHPVFLIDGWLVSDDRTPIRPTWIGEFASLKRGEQGASPHGSAVYRLTLRYTGETMTAAVDFPELFSDYTIWLDGVPLAQGQGNAQIHFELTQGDHLLQVDTHSRYGYYSGMYYPPAMGAPDTLAALRDVRNLAYALAFLVPLALAVFTLLLWQSGGAITRWFALLCCSFALYVSWYFVQLFHLPFASYWFLAENIALYGLCFCVVRLTALSSSHWEHSRVMHHAGGVMLVCSAVLLALCLLIPAFPWAVTLHGILTNFYYVVTFCFTAYFALPNRKERGWEKRWTVVGCLVFGAGLICNLYFSNRFEPIRFFWQFEWCGLLLVGLFGAMMAARNRRIFLENTQLTQHLELLVEQRTEELVRLLAERKAFFSDMAHDLKAPVFATQSFIAAIREGGVGVDNELSHYLTLAENKQMEMARRLQGLSALNALDKIEGRREEISIHALLSEVYANYHGEAQVASVHLLLEKPDKDGTILAQREKLDLLFENLICNALRATPADGCITLSARAEERTVVITVADTGCGISPEELPLIFRRFYVGERNRETGTGLGLYIVQSIVEELGGRITATSAPDMGTTFQMEIPRLKQ